MEKEPQFVGYWIQAHINPIDPKPMANGVTLLDWKHNFASFTAIDEWLAANPGHEVLSTGRQERWEY